MFGLATRKIGTFSNVISCRFDHAVAFLSRGLRHNLFSGGLGRCFHWCFFLGDWLCSRCFSRNSRRFSDRCFSYWCFSCNSRGFACSSRCFSYGCLACSDWRFSSGCRKRPCSSICRLFYCGCSTCFRGSRFFDGWFLRSCYHDVTSPDDYVGENISLQRRMILRHG